MRGRGRPAGLLPAAAVGLLILAGCQREGMDPPAPAGAPDRGGARVVPTLEPDDPVRQGPLGAVAAAPLPVPDVPLDGIDIILHGSVSQDAHLRERTAFWVDFWRTRSRDHFQRYLERMGEYQALVDAELELRELPESLRYLPIVESGYHHSITSRAGATGLWQLMQPTARGLGLSVDGVVDDRRDPVASTVAALDYLEELYAQFGSWYLALAAYNAGPGRVSRALAQYVPDTTLHPDERYLRVRARLPAETREFVPRFFAAAALARAPEVHGFVPPDPTRALAFDEVIVPDATSLDVVALAAEVDEEEIVRLNPHFMRRFTPAGQERIVRVPPGLADTFARNFALIPPEERISFLEHVVASGETLTHIARRYGVSVAELDGANGGLDPRRLQIGQRLVVPVGGARSAQARTAQATGARAGVQGDTDQEALDGPADPDDGSRAARHVVRSGENLWTIARRHGVSVDELRRWNGLREGAVLQPGQELHVGSGARVHLVRSGDTWGGIARRYGVSTAELARLNGRTTRDVIRIGEELRIP